MEAGLAGRSALQHVAGYRASVCSATACPLAAVLEPDWFGFFFSASKCEYPVPPKAGKKP